jgi:hypothetical protein
VKSSGPGNEADATLRTECQTLASQGHSVTDNGMFLVLMHVRADTVRLGELNLPAPLAPSPAKRTDPIRVCP